MTQHVSILAACELLGNSDSVGYGEFILQKDEVHIGVTLMMPISQKLQKVGRTDHGPETYRLQSFLYGVF